MALQRTQILLEPWQHARLKELARQQGTTLSHLVRRMVQKGLEESRGPPKRLLALARGGGVDDGAWGAEKIDEQIYRPED